MASDLTKEEQERVRTAMKFLVVRFGTLAVMATALKLKRDTLRHIMDGKDGVSTTVTFRIARLAQVGIDDLLAGKYPVPGTCPHCGHVAERAVE